MTEQKTNFKFTPTQQAQYFRPSEFIQDELQERGWTTGMLAARMGMNFQDATNLVAGRMDITPEIAKQLAKAFDGQDAQTWINIQASWDFQFTLTDENSDA